MRTPPVEKVAWLSLWPAAVAVGGASSALLLSEGSAQSPALLATLGVVVGLAWCVAGLTEWRRGPRRRIGRLMVFLGFAWFASLWVHTSVSALWTIGQLVRPLFVAVLVHLLLAFPTGRVGGRFARLLVAAAYLNTTVLLLPSVLFLEAPPGVSNLLLVEPHHGLAEGFRNAARGLGVAILLGVLVSLSRRWADATPPSRRALAPMLWVGAAALAAAAARLTNDGLGGPLGPVEIVFFVVLATVPLAFELGVLRARLARGAIAELVVELGQPLAPGGLREALARAVRDPSLALAYWLPEQGGYVDPEGSPVELPTGEDPGLVTTVVEHEGRVVAALVHDSSLSEQRGLMDAVRAAAAIALANERLQVELRARLAELRASRARIVNAADAERRRLERDLHDGAQQRLVAATVALALAEARLESDPTGVPQLLSETRRMLDGALQELRELSQGLHPALLTQRGLGPALRELGYRAPVPTDVVVALRERCPPAVETAAYYVAAEALTNVAKHASASAASVHVERRNGRVLVEVSDDGAGGADPRLGSGLRGLSDRVEALAGTLAIESAAGGGTTLRAEIPCES